MTIIRRLSGCQGYIATTLLFGYVVLAFGCYLYGTIPSPQRHGGITENEVFAMNMFCTTSR